MKIRRTFLISLVCVLFLTGLTGQNIADLQLDLDLSVIKEDNINIIPKFVFPNLQSDQLVLLSEVYIEFKLSAEVMNGLNWPHFTLSAHCVHLNNNNVIGRFEAPNLETGATHFLRISNPADHLIYDPLLNAYSFNIHDGHCAPDAPPYTMIGYVDVILNAYESTWEGGHQTEADYCTDISMDLTEVVFKTTEGEESRVRILNSAQLNYGSECSNAGKEGGNRQKNEAVITINQHSEKSGLEISTNIYPNPVSTYLHIDNLPTANSTALYLYTFQGQLIKVQNTDTQNSKWLIGDLPEGVYWLKITSGIHSYTHRVVVVN